MTPCSNHCSPGRKRGRAAALGAALLACQARGPAFESVATLPDTPRRPAGTEVAPELELPGSTRDASTSAGLVVLESPADPAAARATVAAFFRAVG